MKIRPQLILVEVLLNIVLLLALLFSISAMVNFIAIENLKIKTASLRDTTEQTKLSIRNMLTSTASYSTLMAGYSSLATELDTELKAISEDRNFNRLPEEVRQQFSILGRSWEITQQGFLAANVAELLSHRETSYSERVVSIQDLYAILQADSDADYTFLSEVEDSVLYLNVLENSFVNFETVLNSALDAIVDAADRYRRIQLIAATGIPALVMVLAFLGIFLFSTRLTRKLTRLDRALVDIGGGDFSVRVDVKGRDEFSSLGTSVNAFTRTLGAKLESFRLMMHEIGQTLSTDVESTRVEETLLKLAMRDTVADGAALYKVGGEAGELVLSLTEGRFRPPFTVTDMPQDPGEEDIEALLRSRIIQPGRTMIGQSAVQGKADMIRNVVTAENISWSREEGDPLFLASIIVVPLMVGTTVFGAIAITSSKPGKRFTDLEFANMQSFGELAAITLDNIYKYADLLEATQLNRELGIAEEIQQDLLPKRLPRLSSGEVAYLSRSIKGLNGDYFDVYPLGEGKTMVTICEVAGRGVPAGLVMVMIRTILRLVAGADTDAKTIMSRLNRDMTRRIAIDNYASVGILILDNNGTYTFSSAAHYPLQILRTGAAEYEAVQTEGIPVGIDKNAEYIQETGSLGTGDLLVFHTDGIPESRSRDGKIFGIENLLKTVSERAQAPPEEIIEGIRLELEHFERGTDQKDDQTVIILKYTGGEAA